MSRVLHALPLSAERFAPFGTLLAQPQSTPSLERGDITFWNATADLSGLAGSGVTGHLIAHRRDLTLTQIERHLHTPEAFIATAGRSLMVVGRPGDLVAGDFTSGNLGPDALCVFEMSAGQAVLLHPGSWHWAPFPLTETASFLLVLRAETSEHDIDIQDIPAHRLEPPAPVSAASPGPSP
ncbi:ureidoglycolate lyase [Deinococcus altitudinis]|uniref:ureidoglycolate lyase n=1 Tax=Deinococcus altitudinis TaxID=468914 RepID=UPI003891ADEF